MPCIKHGHKVKTTLLIIELAHILYYLQHSFEYKEMSADNYVYGLRVQKCCLIANEQGTKIWICKNTKENKKIIEEQKLEVMMDEIQGPKAI
jgi:hypothetical protein